MNDDLFEDLKPTRAPATVTRGRLSSSDHYRCQCNLPNPIAWAVCYAVLVDWNKHQANHNRDALGKDIQRYLLGTFNGLCESEDFQKFAKAWIELNVSKDCAELVDRFLKTNTALK